MGNSSIFLCQCLLCFCHWETPLYSCVNVCYAFAIGKLSYILVSMFVMLLPLGNSTMFLCQCLLCYVRKLHYILVSMFVMLFDYMRRTVFKQNELIPFKLCYNCVLNIRATLNKKTDLAGIAGPLNITDI